MPRRLTSRTRCEPSSTAVAPGHDVNEIVVLVDTAVGAAGRGDLLASP
ncbi:hypothetical protein ABZZ36_42300 [Actinacidiphila glaucinigra]